MRAGLARGFAPPAVPMAGREGTARTVAQAADAAGTGYLTPFTSLPETTPGRQELIAQATAVIETSVIPAYRELLQFLLQEYLPGLPEDVSVSSTPGGAEYYRAQLREYTTTDLD